MRTGLRVIPVRALQALPQVGTSLLQRVRLLQCARPKHELDVLHLLPAARDEGIDCSANVLKGVVCSWLWFSSIELT
jgi:hypothetical protein